MLNISVIIPVYNASAFLKKAIESALQFEEVKEILLIEDKSTDNSLEICENLAAENPRIKLFQHHDNGNYGAGATRNLGLEKASQEFIAFLDADDYYLPNRFEAEKELFKNEKIEGVFGAIGTEFLSEKGKKEFQQKFKNVDLTTMKKPCEGKEIFNGLIGLDATIGSFFHLNGLTVRRKSLEKNDLKFNENLRVHQDSDFNAKLSYHCFLKSGILDQAIAIRGVHDDNRITKIKPYSTKFYENMFLLHESMYLSSKNISELSPETRDFIEMKYLLFKTAKMKGTYKILKYFQICLSYPILLKTQYRFHILKR